MTVELDEPTTDPRLVELIVGNPDLIVHRICHCRPEVGICGTSVLGIPMPELTCVVCVDLVERNAPCPSCGLPNYGPTC